MNINGRYPLSVYIRRDRQKNKIRKRFLSDVFFFFFFYFYLFISVELRFQRQRKLVLSIWTCDIFFYSNDLFFQIQEVSLSRDVARKAINQNTRDFFGHNFYFYFSFFVKGGLFQRGTFCVHLTTIYLRLSPVDVFVAFINIITFLMKQK